MITLKGKNIFQFFAYVRKLKRYFGKDYLTANMLFTLYLDYDVKNNFIRREILGLMKGNKEQAEVNQDIMDFLKEDEEETLQENSFLETEPFRSPHIMSKSLHDVMSRVWIQHKDVNLPLYADLHEMMYQAYFCNDSAIKKTTFANFLEIGFGVSFPELKKKLKESKITTNRISGGLQEYSEFFEKFSGPYSFVDGYTEDNEIVARKDIMELIWTSFMRENNNNVFIVASSTADKTGIIRNLAYMLKQGTAPKEFAGKEIIEVDFMKIINAMSPIDETTCLIDELKKVAKELAEDNIYEGNIFYFKNFSIMMDDEDVEYRNIYVFFELFKKANCNVICPLTKPAYDKFALNEELFRKIMFITITEPDKDESPELLRVHSRHISKYHGVLISTEMLKKAMLFAKALESTCTYTDTKKLMDVSMVHARMKDEISVTIDDIRQFFAIKFEAYRKQSDEIKKLTAFHEAGHFVVSRFCENFKGIYVDLVSIIPSEYFGGVNMFEYDSSQVKSSGYHYYLEYLSISLAGRASEELFLGLISSGAEGDLQSATDVATEMVANLGLDKGRRFYLFSPFRKKDNKTNFVVKGNENLKSEKSLNQTSEKVSQLMQEAYNLAIKILKEHEQYVNALASMLLAENIVSRDEIICYEYTVDGVVKLKYNKA